jgi:hypothetical protein
MSEFINVLTLENENEAAIIEGILKERNIPYILRNLHDSSFDGLFQNQYGWGIIESYEKYYDEINNIYTEIVKI